jgi:hypothetical protein
VVAGVVNDLLAFALLVWGRLPVNDPLRGGIGGANGTSGFYGVLNADRADPTVNPNVDLRNLTNLWAAVQQGQAAVRQVSPFGLTAPPNVQAFLEILQQELCIQRDAEERWENLVKSMAPNCFGLETSLAGGVFFTGSMGENR